jgi:thiamine biosynthesis lipoprotein
MQKFKWSQIYPFLVIFLMYVVYEYRNNKKEKQTATWEEIHINRIKIQGETMGTTYTIVYYDSLKRNIKPEVDSLLENFNTYLSTYIPTSEISLFNQTNYTDSLSPYLYRVLQKSKEIHLLSKGTFDPTVMPLVNMWGFGYKKITKLPDTLTIDSVNKHVGFEKIHFTDSTLSSSIKVELGFGAIAKGYGVDLVGDLLSKRGINTYLIEIGGENLTKGTKPDGKQWTLGILYPEKLKAMKNIYYCGVNIKNRAMATSGPYMQQKEINGLTYSHTIDPRTGFPVEQSILSICVLANDCMTADALATTLNVFEIEEAKIFFKENTQYDGLLLFLENGVIKEFRTPGFNKIQID